MHSAGATPRGAAGTWLAVGCAGALAIAYLTAPPIGRDLAAQIFRVDHFAEHGYALWSTAWYSGHHLLGYSLLYPPLGDLLGVRTVAALAVVAAAALFTVLVRRSAFAETSLIPGIWFAIGVASWLYTGRLTFLLGVALGLGALLALSHGRLVLAAALAALTAAASSVAGLFLALAGAAIALTGRRRDGALLALSAAALIGVLNFAFPTGGEQPFPFSTYFPIPLACVAVWAVLPREQRELRLGVLLYGVVATAVFLVETPIGSNVVRLGALFAGPLAALALVRRPLVLVLLAIPLAYWQLHASVRDVVDSAGDPSVESGFYEPLLGELDRIEASRGGPIRLHIPPTLNRSEAAYVAPSHPLARGWLRQLEVDDFELFEGERLDPDSYRAWLERNAVELVAVPEAPRDYLARDEVALIATGLGYLKSTWKSPDWHLYRVSGSRPSGLAGAGLEELAPAGFRLAADGSAGRLPIHWTPYWDVIEGEGCLVDDGGWTRVEDRGEEPLAVSTSLSVSGALGRDRVCSE